MIVIFCGLPGTGKTTLAKELAPLIDAIILSTDKIRKQLIPKPTYKRYERELIYDVMMLIAKYLHKARKNCILDATFNKESSRKDVINKLGLLPNQVFIVECACPEDVVISRLESRRADWSDADVSVYRKMKKIYEPVKGKHITANTLQIPHIIAKEISQIIKKNQ